MQATALITDARQNFSLQPVALPDPAPDQILVQTTFSGVSIGTEFALIRNKISWGPYPLCTGYQGSGVVKQVGSALTGFKPGDRVYFRQNASISLASGEKVSPVCGTHCSHVVLNPGGTHGADHVPENCPMDLASLFAMPAVGANGVDMAQPRMGEHVVVYGAGLIGLGVVAACAARGCVVTAVDVNPLALEAARKLGADYAVNSKQQDVEAHVKSISPKGADAVFESTGLPALIDPAIALCRTEGTFVWQGNYGAAPISFHFLPAHGRRLRMVFPCDDGYQPSRRHVTKAMARGALPWQHAITHRISFKEAPDTFARINRNEPGYLGVIINWS